MKILWRSYYPHLVNKEMRAEIQSCSLYVERGNFYFKSS